MAHSNPWLVLFDIDGTLIQSGKAGLRGMNRAFEQLYGRPGALTGVPIAGRTDRAIVIDGMRAIGQAPTNTEIVRLREAYFADLRTEICRPVSDPSGILPGVVDMLDDMTTRPDVIVALLTGNFHGGAAIKLGHFGLWERFPFGAFGDEHTDRRALVPLAARLAAEAGYGTPPPERIVIIGDTPLDVDCARAYGARSLAVATGMYNAESLAEAGADLVVPTLEHAGDVLSRLL